MNTFENTENVIKNPSVNGAYSIGYIIDLLKQYDGVKVKHFSFDKNEYLYSKHGFVYDENNYLFENWVDDYHNGIRIRLNGAFDNGWSVIEMPTFTDGTKDSEPY